MVFMFLNSRSDIFWMIPIMGFFQIALFGGYAIYFPELFPTRLRSTGTSFCYNVGRLIAASGPALLGLLISPAVFGAYRGTAPVPLRRHGHVQHLRAWASRSPVPPRDQRQATAGITSMMNSPTVPGWLAQRDGAIQMGVQPDSHLVLIGGQPLYRLDVRPAAGRFACAVINSANGRRLDDAATTYASFDEALAGGLNQLREGLGW